VNLIDKGKETAISTNMNENLVVVDALYAQDKIDAQKKATKMN